MWMQTHRPEVAIGLEKRDPRLLRALDMVMSLYDDGRVIAIADEEVHRILDEAFAGVAVG
jgi:hypothetical protein